MLRRGRPARWVLRVESKYWRNINPLSRKENIILKRSTDKEAKYLRVNVWLGAALCSLLLSQPTSPPNWIYFPVNRCRNTFAALQELKVKLPECWFYTAAQWSEPRHASPCILPRFSDQVAELVFDSQLAGQTTARSEGPNGEFHNF